MSNEINKNSSVLQSVSLLKFSIKGLSEKKTEIYCGFTAFAAWGKVHSQKIARKVLSIQYLDFQEYELIFC